MPSAPLGIGIIGLGGVGLTHARALDKLRADAELWCFSGGSTGAAASSGWPQAQQVPPDEVARHPKVDVIVVCSPSGEHAKHTLEALEQGRHVVVEKPLALRVEDAERIVARASERNRWVSMIAQRRFEKEYRAVKKMIEAGRLGTLRLALAHVHWSRDDRYYDDAPWRRSMTAGGGSLMNQGVHSVDLLRWLCGPVEEVTAQYATVSHEMSAEDTTVATVRFASGALGVISTSTATPPGEPAVLTMYFDRGSITLGQGEVLRWEVDGVPSPANTNIGPSSGASDPKAIGDTGHLAQWRQIVQAWEEGRAPAVGANDAAETVRLLCAIYEAGATGRAVRPAELS